MLLKLHDRLLNLDRYLREKAGNSIATPGQRRRAWWHFQFVDHAFLRGWWTNLAEVAPEVWRANQPSPRKLAHHKRRLGLKAVLNLRGEAEQSHYLFEAEACRDLGLELVSVRLAARSLPKPVFLFDLLEAFETLPRPFLMHCKSGSDRAGFAAALYLIAIEGRPVAEAKRQLHWKHLHLRSTRTGVLDHFFDAYQADTIDEPIPLRDWIASRYDRDALQAEFMERLSGRRG
ncbi:MAG TPA: protein tyrosine phosphatase [Rhodobacteraceae bacterium]|jgi:protein tyrosine/serine phosphatase|nr:tyrosine-protein phosphatase [Paracoccaceae bacterium]HBH00136.1 protein tyrosine phosphatase [Paracoccaceae bacterium]